MKIFTDNQFNEFIEKYTKEIRSESFKVGYDAGYKFGLNEGLTADKEGVYFCKSGLYVFKDGTLTDVKTETL
jgi:hypothetical protein